MIAAPFSNLGSWLPDSPLIETEDKIVRALPDAAEAPIEAAARTLYERVFKGRADLGFIILGKAELTMCFYGQKRGVDITLRTLRTWAGFPVKTRYGIGPIVPQIPPSVTANIAVHAAKPGSEIASADGSMCQQTSSSRTITSSFGESSDVLHPEGEETHGDR